MRYDGAMAIAVTLLQPRQRVRITQQIPQGTSTWTTTVEGEVVAYRQAKTGSWFAHSKDDRLWLDRLEIRRDDGEIVVCNLDRFSRVDVFGESPEAGKAAGAAADAAAEA